jgi:hypothetical protein
LFIKLLTSTVLIKLLDPDPDPNSDPNPESGTKISDSVPAKKARILSDSDPDSDSDPQHCFHDADDERKYNCLHFFGVR